MALMMHLRLDDERHAPAIARRTTASILRGAVPVDIDLVSLLVNELVVLLHRADPDHQVDVRLEATPALLRVNVAGPPAPGGERATPETLTAGWALLVMDRVAHRWGVDDDHAVRFWFEVDLDTVEVA